MIKHVLAYIRNLPVPNSQTSPAAHMILRGGLRWYVLKLAGLVAAAAVTPLYLSLTLTAGFMMFTVGLVLFSGMVAKAETA